MMMTILHTDLCVDEREKVRERYTVAFALGGDALSLIRHTSS